MTAKVEKVARLIFFGSSDVFLILFYLFKKARKRGRRKKGFAVRAGPAYLFFCEVTGASIKGPRFRRSVVVMARGSRTDFVSRFMAR